MFGKKVLDILNSFQKFAVVFRNLPAVDGVAFGDVFAQSFGAHFLNSIATFELVRYPTPRITSRAYRITGLSDFAICIFCILLF